MGDNNIRIVDYTNRRRIELSPADSCKNNEQRKMESEHEFEQVCLQIDQCSISKKSFAKKLHSAPSRSSASSLTSHPQVEEFQRFLDEFGGHYGGWKVKDHLFFVKTRSKNPLNMTAEMVNGNFPDISKKEVVAHDAWYTDYTRLRAANKNAIEEWKKSQKVSLRVEEKPIEDTKPESAPVKRDPNVKQKIEIWRAHVLAAKLEKMEEQKQEEIRKKKEEEERKKMQEDKRASVNRYREEKLSYEMAMKAAFETEKLEAKREAARHTATLLKYFRYEDRRFSERQRALRQQQQPIQKEFKRRDVGVERDFNRLLMPTKNWINHIKKPDPLESDSLSLSLPIQQMQKLGKPAWRRGISA